MLTKKQLKKLDKLFAKQLKQYKKRKRYCQRAYPDWRDDEYNTLDNLFIWAMVADNSDEKPSFCSLNDAIVYYNRESEQYILDVDLTIYDCGDQNSMKKMIDKLMQIERSFAAWTQMACPGAHPIFDPEDYFVTGLVAYDLPTLCLKLDLAIAGLRRFYEQTFPIDE